MKAFITVLYSLVLVYKAISHEGCSFYQYAGSTHYQTARTSPKKFLEDGLFRDNQQHRQSRKRLLYGAGRSAMRISLDVDDFTTIKASANGEALTTMANLNFVKKAMQVAKYFYEQRLKVSPEMTVTIPSTCYDYTVPATDVANGVGPTDLHIYAIYVTNSSAGFGATGVSCAWSASSNGAVDPTLKSGKPTVGRIIFNTYRVVDTRTPLTNRLFSAITATALHQTMHILGFDQSLYSNYLDYNTGLPYSYPILQSVALHPNRVGGPNYLLKTPAVTAWALAHYGCVNITGMPLQNQDGSGALPGSHWERLTAYDQLMTGTELGPQKTFTALSFALLKDMGWYGVDATFNDTTNYGYQQGCSFFFDACYGGSPNVKYFCNEGSFVNVSECSSTFTGKATCSRETAMMTDGCGMFKQYLFCVDPASTADAYRSSTLQAFGTTTLCAKGTIATVGITQDYRSRCYPFVCNLATQSITFTIGPYTLNCFSNEQGLTKTVTGMQGSLECPKYNDFCVNSRKICPNWCSGNGFCTRGVCNCYQDTNIVYSGEDCSITTCAASNSYYYAVSSSCVPSCPTGFYVNIQSKSCLPCSSLCQQCRDQSTICTSCQSTPSNPQYYYAAANTCVGQCPSDTYLQTDTCILCDSTTAGCATCSGSPTVCTSCVNPAYYLNQFGNCGTACTGSYNLYDDINMKCQQSCPNYLYLSNSHCIRCSPGYKVIDDFNNVCQPSCPAGYYTDTTNALCGNCNETCLACDGKYSQNCTSCKQAGTTLKYLHLKMCLNACPDGLYADDTAGACLTCIISLNCATCHVVATVVVCKTCRYGYYLHPNQSCVRSCDPTYYTNRWNNSCDPCDASCRDCSGPANSGCLNCVGPSLFLQNSSGGYCLSACPSVGYVTFLSSTCLACHQTCLTCINETSAGCVTCQSSLYLESNRCRYVCSPGMYPQATSKACLPCNSNCNYCFGSTVDNCTQCNSGFVLNNFTCGTSCPTGQTANNFSVCEKKAFEKHCAFILLALLFAMLLV